MTPVAYDRQPMTTLRIELVLDELVYQDSRGASGPRTSHDNMAGTIKYVARRSYQMRTSKVIRESTAAGL